MDGISRSSGWDRQDTWMGYGNSAQCFAYGTAFFEQ